jgi:ArsR family transcriptional regulator, arsenate/arsenite/antimonite-responsive transcriptional repressor
MGVTKTEHFTEHQNRTATLLKAMAHPARVAIVEQLLKVDTCVCGDFVNELPLAQPTVSQHLKELKNAGIIKGTVEGTSVCYCLNEAVFAALQVYFNQMGETLSKQKPTCC